MGNLSIMAKVIIVRSCAECKYEKGGNCTKPPDAIFYEGANVEMNVEYHILHETLHPDCPLEEEK